MSSVLQALIFAAVLIQLVLIARQDLKHLRISNCANLGLALTYALYAFLFQAWPNMLMHVATGATIFFLLLWPFARNMVGGGDVKFLFVAGMWIGPQGISLFSFALLVSLLFYLLCARMRLLPMHQDNKLHRIPFGPSGAAALAITLGVSAFI